MAGSITAFASTSVCVSLALRVGQTFHSPHNQVCAHSFVAICQIEMCAKHWSDEAVGAAGRLKDSVMRH